MTAKRPAVPSGLGGPGRRLFSAVTSRLGLDEWERELLSQAAHVADRMAELQTTIDREGLTARKTLQGPLMPHPLCAELRAQQAIFTRLIQALQLPTGLAGDAPPEISPARRRYRATRYEMDKLLRPVDGTG